MTAWPGAIEIAWLRQIGRSQRTQYLLINEADAQEAQRRQSCPLQAEKGGDFAPKSPERKRLRRRRRSGSFLTSNLLVGAGLPLLVPNKDLHVGRLIPLPDGVRLPRLGSHQNPNRHQRRKNPRREDGAGPMDGGGRDLLQGGLEAADAGDHEVVLDLDEGREVVALRDELLHLRLRLAQHRHDPVVDPQPLRLGALAAVPRRRGHPRAAPTAAAAAGHGWILKFGKGEG